MDVEVTRLEQNYVFVRFLCVAAKMKECSRFQYIGEKLCGLRLGQNG